MPKISLEDLHKAETENISRKIVEELLTPLAAFDDDLHLVRQAIRVAKLKQFDLTEINRLNNKIVDGLESRKKAAIEHGDITAAKLREEQIKKIQSLATSPPLQLIYLLIYATMFYAHDDTRPNEIHADIIAQLQSIHEEEKRITNKIEQTFVFSSHIQDAQEELELYKKFQNNALSEAKHIFNRAVEKQLITPAEKNTLLLQRNEFHETTYNELTARNTVVPISQVLENIFHEDIKANDTQTLLISNKWQPLAPKPEKFFTESYSLQDPVAITAVLGNKPTSKSTLFTQGKPLELKVSSISGGLHINRETAKGNIKFVAYAVNKSGDKRLFKNAKEIVAAYKFIIKASVANGDIPLSLSKLTEAVNLNHINEKQAEEVYLFACALCPPHCISGYEVNEMIRREGEAIFANTQRALEQGTAALHAALKKQISQAKLIQPSITLEQFIQLKPEEQRNYFTDADNKQRIKLLASPLISIADKYSYLNLCARNIEDIKEVLNADVIAPSDIAHWLNTQVSVDAAEKLLSAIENPASKDAIFPYLNQNLQKHLWLNLPAGKNSIDKQDKRIKLLKNPALSHDQRIELLALQARTATNLAEIFAGLIKQTDDSFDLETAIMLYTRLTNLLPEKQTDSLLDKIPETNRTEFFKRSDITPNLQAKLAEHWKNFTLLTPDEEIALTPEEMNQHALLVADEIPLVQKIRRIPGKIATQNAIIAPAEQGITTATNSSNEIVKKLAEARNNKLTTEKNITENIVIMRKTTRNLKLLIKAKGILEQKIIAKKLELDQLKSAPVAKEIPSKEIAREVNGVADGIELFDFNSDSFQKPDVITAQKELAYLMEQLKIAKTKTNATAATYKNAKENMELAQLELENHPVIISAYENSLSALHTQRKFLRATIHDAKQKITALTKQEKEARDSLVQNKEQQCSIELRPVYQATAKTAVVLAHLTSKSLYKFLTSEYLTAKYTPQQIEAVRTQLDELKKAWAKETELEIDHLLFSPKLDINLRKEIFALFNQTDHPRILKKLLRKQDRQITELEVDLIAELCQGLNIAQLKHLIETLLLDPTKPYPLATLIFNNLSAQQQRALITATEAAKQQLFIGMLNPVVNGVIKVFTHSSDPLQNIWVELANNSLIAKALAKQPPAVSFKNLIDACNDSPALQANLFLASDNYDAFATIADSAQQAKILDAIMQSTTIDHANKMRIIEQIGRRVHFTESCEKLAEILSKVKDYRIVEWLTGRENLDGDYMAGYPRPVFLKALAPLDTTKNPPTIASGAMQLISAFRGLDPDQQAELFADEQFDQAYKDLLFPFFDHLKQQEFITRFAAIPDPSPDESAQLTKYITNPNLSAAHVIALFNLIKNKVGSALEVLYALNLNEELQNKLFIKSPNNVRTAFLTTNHDDWLRQTSLAISVAEFTNQAELRILFETVDPANQLNVFLRLTATQQILLITNRDTWNTPNKLADNLIVPILQKIPSNEQKRALFVHMNNADKQLILDENDNKLNEALNPPARASLRLR